MESAHHSYEMNRHGKSHAMIRLPVHLENRQMVIFQEGQEQEALDAAQDRDTELTAWFKLNRIDPQASTLLYSEIPFSYVFDNREWKGRKAGADKILSRIYSISPRMKELFFLRILLLHIRGKSLLMSINILSQASFNFRYIIGAISYEDLRTFRGITHPTYEGAAVARNLVENGAQWLDFFERRVAVDMPHELR